MQGKLSSEQITLILQSEIVGRIGCYAEGKVYIVPVSYAYHHGYIYAHSKEGMKIRMMRQNPSVCFQVDQLDNRANWRSIIVWGTYEELGNLQEQFEGRQILENRLSPYINSETVSPLNTDLLEKPHGVEKPLKPIMFRIKITESTGRYVKTTFTY